MATFALKCYTGPAGAKSCGDDLRAIAHGFDFVTETVDHVFFTLSGDPSAEAAAARAADIIRVAEIKGLGPLTIVGLILQPPTYENTRVN